jgi:hypothetical protein
MTIQEFRNLLGENQNVAIFVGIGFLLLILLIYLFLRNIFSKDSTDYVETSRNQNLSMDLQKRLNIPAIIAEEDLANYVERLQLLSIEGTAIARKLETQVAEKGQEIKDMESYLEQLQTQEESLKGALEEAGVAPVPLLNAVRYAALQQKAKRKATVMLWTGLLLGILLGIVALAAYAYFILKITIWQVS